jgi:hypothetical protein
MTTLNIPMLDDCVNTEAIYERIESAARQAMPKIVLEQLTLGWNEPVPTLDQVRKHLADLVNTALEDYHIELRHAPAGFLPEDVQGEAFDDLFEVWVGGAYDEKLRGLRYDVNIAQRLTD